MEISKWQVINQMLGSQRMYIVGRVIDPSRSLHIGNIEYAPDSHYTTDKEKAEKLANEMNKKEK